MADHMTDKWAEAPLAATGKHVHVEPHVDKANLIGNSEQESRTGTLQRLSQLQTMFGCLRTIRRLLALVTAILYVLASTMSAMAAVTVLRGQEYKSLPPEPYNNDLMAGYAGVGSLAGSPLVQRVLQGDTSTNRSDVVYLETPTTFSFDGCTKVEAFDSYLYGATYLRFLFTQLKTQLAYNFTLMNDLDLIAPVVDCTFDLLEWGDVSGARVFYLTRKISDPAKVILLSTSMSVQNYYITSHLRRGPALFASMAIIDDMSAATIDYKYGIALNYPYEAIPNFVVCEVIETTVNGFWRLHDVPVNAATDDQREILSSFLVGFYIDSAVSQSNIHNWYWNVFPNNPVAEVTNWSWQGFTESRDSWAWSHCVHGIFAFYTAFQICVLLLVMFQRFRAGDFWIGDAFASVSSSLLYRGVFVLISNQLNGYYTWTEYALSIGYTLADVSSNVHYRWDLILTDMLTLYINVVSVISYAVKERIDPTFAFATFGITYYFRTNAVKLLPFFRTALEAYATSNYALAKSQVGTSVESLAPFSLYTVQHAKMDGRFMAIGFVIASLLFGLGNIGLFIIARKLLRRRRRSKLAASTGARRTESLQRRPSGQIDSELTMFESATGAVLSSRYGVITDYENYLTENDKRYATIDAVYGTGFLVANRRFLIARGDLMAILIIKLTRIRFKNVFVYEFVDKETPKQTSRLLYPRTIDWSDLSRLDVCKLR